VTKFAPTLCRVLLFCILCAGALAFTSGLIGNVKGRWWQASFFIVAALISVILSKLFARWERIKMIDIGIIPDIKSLSKFFIGLGIGLVLAALQPALVLMAGHVNLTPVSAVSYTSIITSFILYLAIGLREEISFRGFPLFSLQRIAGSWLALLSIGIIFIIEHRLGGMNWWSAVLGPGVGSILFGLAAIKQKVLLSQSVFILPGILDNGYLDLKMKPVS
jgi:membrane protease YdiL (CAAX protease family)